MKKMPSFYQLVLICFLITGIVSCKDKDNVAPVAKSDTYQEFQTLLGKKWQVQSIAASRYARVAAFEQPWFEFFSTDSKYVVNDGGTIYYGSYIVNATRDTITLNDFGIIAISKLTETTFDFSLKKNGQTDFVVVFTTAVDSTIPSSPATELLCEKQWTINWQVPEGEDTLFYNNTSSGITKIEVRFSKNGTYLNHTETTDAFGNSDIVKYWRWNNTAQTEIQTSSSDTFEDPDSNLILIKKLTEQEWNFSYGTIVAGSASR